MHFGNIEPQISENCTNFLTSSFMYMQREYYNYNPVRVLSGIKPHLLLSADATTKITYGVGYSKLCCDCLALDLVDLPWITLPYLDLPWLDMT